LFVWLVVILLIINISVFIAFKFFDAGLIFKHKINVIIEQTLDAQVSMDDFSLNDRQIFISNLSLEENQGKYKFKASQVYVDYNLFFVIFSNFSQTKPIKDVRIFDPELQINITQKSDIGFDIPDIKRWFKNIKLENGLIDIQINQPDFQMNTYLDSIYINVKNDKQSHIEIKSHSSNRTEIVLDARVDELNINQLKANISNFHVENLRFGSLLQTDIKASAMIDYDGDNALYDLYLNKTSIDLIDDKLINLLSTNELKSQDLRFYGNEKKAYLKASILSDSTLSVELNGELSDPFDNKEAYLNYEIKNYILPPNTDVDGIINASGSVECNLNELIKNSKRKEIMLEADILSDSVNYQGHEIKDIAINLHSRDFWEQNMHFTTNKFSALNGLNQVTGEFCIKDKYFSGNIQADSVSYVYNGLELEGTLQSGITYSKKGFVMQNNIENTKLKYKGLELEQIHGQLNTKNDNIDIKIAGKDDALNFVYKGNVKKEEHHIQVKLNDLRLQKDNNFLANIPLSGDIKIDFADGLLKSLVDVSVAKQLTYALYGDFNSELSVDFNKEVSKISCSLTNAYYNLHPISFNLQAEGDLDKLKSTKFTINNKVEAQISAGLKPNFYYQIESNKQALDLKDIMQYFVDIDINRRLKGTFMLDSLFYNSGKDNSLIADFSIDKMQYSDSNELEMRAKITGEPKNISLESFDVYSSDKLILSSSGYIKDFGDDTIFEANLTGKLSDIINIPDTNAELNGDFCFQYFEDSPTFKAKFAANNLVVNNESLNALTIDIEQLDQELIINDLSLGPSTYFNIQGKGSLGYNLIRKQSYGSDETLNFDLNLDVLGYLRKEIELVDHVESKFIGFAEIKTNDEGINIQAAELKMIGGKLKLQDQPQLINRINMHFIIDDNMLYIVEMGFRMGKGGMSFRNEIMNNEEDFVLGNINLGHIYISSYNDGILLNVPSYSPKNTVTNIEVKGRNSNEFEIKGPFDDIHLTGDLIFKNGTGVYPAKSENLLKYVNTFMTKRDRKSQRSYSNYERMTEQRPRSDYPFTLDLVMRFTNNMRYVTYPLNLLVNPDSYLEISYKNGRWGVNSASFVSESGELEIFGTIFDANYVMVKITPFDFYPIIQGSFYKKAPDGTIYYLDISSDPSIDNYLESFTLSLKSDNLEDKNIFQMLSKLRYGKSLDEISEQGEQAILQDEALQLFGVGLGSAFINPYLTPFETKIRKWMKLDSFDINPGFVQNLFNEYKSDSQTKLKGQDKDILRFSSSIFLNNLSVNFGKYLSNRFFLNYEAVFQEETDIFEKSNLYMYNNFSLRYDFPYKVQGIYEFRLKPNNKQEEHQIFFMRKFKF
jgi:hypothetical protein